MKSKRLVYGRQREISKLEEIVKSEKSEFVAVYGRRRVGKTFLIKEYFDYTFDFHITGLANADTGQQLFNFDCTQFGAAGNRDREGTRRSHHEDGALRNCDNS